MLATGTEPSTTPRVLLILGSVLEHLVARNDQLATSCDSSYWANGFELGSSQVGKNVKVFDGVRVPSISIEKYLERLYKYTKCSPSCYVVGFVYMDRLMHKHPQLVLGSLNVHRLLVTSLLVASKVLDDVQYNNAFHARIGGVSNAELNKLEVELLFLLDFEVMVSSSVFEIYCLHLEKEMLRIDNNFNHNLNDDDNDSNNVVLEVEKAFPLLDTDDVVDRDLNVNYDVHVSIEEITS